MHAHRGYLAFLYDIGKAAVRTTGYTVGHLRGDHYPTQVDAADQVAKIRFRFRRRQFL